MAPTTPSEKALHEFVAAFERLKNNRPLRLIAGSRVSQNNVAREAGRDASSLKRSLYPGLVQSIKDWIAANCPQPPSSSSPVARIRREKQALQDRVATLEAEVDELRRERDRYFVNTIASVGGSSFRRPD